MEILDEKDFEDSFLRLDNSEYESKIAKEISRLMDKIRKQNRHLILVTPNLSKEDIHNHTRQHLFPLK